MTHPQPAVSRRLATAALCIAALLALGACGGSNDEASPTAAQPPAAALPFKSLPARVSLATGSQSALAAIGASAAVTWSSSNAAVATVDANGIVTAIGRGQASIIATDGTHTSASAVGVWNTTGTTPDASSGALIDAAFASGRIDAEQAILYRVFAQFGDDRLPPELQGAPDRDGTVSMQLLSAQLPTLSASTQADLRPFFIPPIYVDSWFGRQLGLSSGTTAQQAGGRRTAQGSSGRAAAPPFNCSQVLIPGLEKRTTLSFTFWTFANPVTVQAIDYLAGTVEDIYSRLRALLQRAAKPDTEEPCSGGDGSIDVFVFPYGQIAETIAYPGRCQNVPAYIVINSGEVGLALSFVGSDATAGPRYLRSLLAHEVTHTIQFGMTRQAACPDYKWIDEATAQWAMDELFPGDNFEDGLRQVEFAPRAGTFFADYVLGGHRGPLEQANGYGDYIFFQFIARKLGSQVVKQVFDAWAGNDSVQSLDVALRASGSSLRDVWPEFARAMWNDASRHVLDDLNRMPMEGYVYGVQYAFDTLKAQGRLDTRKIQQQGAGNARFELMPHLKSGAGYSLPPRSMAFEHLDFNDANVASVLVTIPFAGVKQPEVKLQAVAKIGGQWKPVEDWTGEVSRSFCRDKASERLEELILIVSNGDNVPASQPVLTTQPMSVSTSNVGCWRWQGTATHRILGDDGAGNTGDYIAQVQNVVFEPQGSFAGTLMLATTAGEASGRYVTHSASPVCDVTLTGPTKAVSATDGMLWLQLGLDAEGIPSADRNVTSLLGTTFIDTTSHGVCPALGLDQTQTFLNAWAWLLYPLLTNPLSVSDDGRTIEGNLTEVQGDVRTIHTFTFTAMRE